MGFQKTIDNRVRKLTHFLHYQNGIRKTRLSIVSGLHYYVVDDILKYMRDMGLVVEKEGLWFLIDPQETHK